MRVRESARLILLDEDDRVFLFEHNSPVPTSRAEPDILRYWVTPGGGVEEGETCEQAARCELWEETGIGDTQIGPWIWTREGHVQYSKDVLSRERYFLVHCAVREISNEHQLENERRVYRRHHWWSLQELRDTHDIVYPADLAELIAPLIDGIVPVEPIRLLE